MERNNVVVATKVCSKYYPGEIQTQKKAKKCFLGPPACCSVALNSARIPQIKLVSTCSCENIPFSFMIISPG